MNVDWQKTWAEQGRWLATVLRARGIHAGEVDDLLQEVRTRALAAEDRLRDAHQIAPWLYRIAVTTALEYRRRMGRRRGHQARYRDAYAGDAVERREPLDWLLAEEQKQLVRQALDELPSRDAEILLLKYTENWSYRELAHHLGASYSAIEARLHRAREKLRRVLTRVAPEYVPEAEASPR